MNGTTQTKFQKDNCFLQLREVTKRFGGIRALEGVNLEIRRGEVLGLLGDNGAGKSTLALGAAGLIRPQSGRVRFDGGSRPRPGLDVALLFQDPQEQLWGAIGAVFSSWMNQRAVTYRRLHDIPEAWGTAVNVQAMVFGNMGETSATGVAFTRNPSTGDGRLYGEFLINAQGEDVVAGIRTPQSLTRVAREEMGEEATIYQVYSLCWLARFLYEEAGQAMEAAPVLAEALALNPDAISGDWTAELAQAYALRAVQALLKVGVRRNPVIDLSLAQAALVGATRGEQQDLQVLAGQTLAYLNSPDAQRAIAEMALSDAYDMDVRIDAFASLANSAKLNGNLLPDATVDQIYGLTASDETEPDLRAAAAAAYGALNLPSQKVKELILDQSRS